MGGRLAVVAERPNAPVLKTGARKGSQVQILPTALPQGPPPAAAAPPPEAQVADPGND